MISSVFPSSSGEGDQVRPVTFPPGCARFLARPSATGSALPAIMTATAGLRRAGSAALDLCDVACGRFEGFWELRLAPWDFAAGALIAAEAGAIVTDMHGAALETRHSSMLAANPAMHAWLLERLRVSSPAAS